MIDEKKLLDDFEIEIALRAGLYGRAEGSISFFDLDIRRMIRKQPKIQEWIPCSERLPEEHESVFAKFKGTDRWWNDMYEKTSGTVLVTVEDKGGHRAITTAHTCDGKWEADMCFNSEVIAWQPFPEAYHG